MFYRAVRFLLHLLLRIFFRFRVEGAEREPPTGPLIVIANHASALDPIAVGCALRRQVCFMAKQELFRLPGTPWLLAALGAFPVRRGEPDRQALRAAMQVIQRGAVLGMFPEGTRSLDGRVKRAEPGAALLALRTGVLILPVVVIGSLEAMPKGARRIRRGRLTVRIGSPMRLDHAGAGRPARGAIEAAGDQMMGELARLLGQEWPPRPPVSETPI